MTIHSTRLFAEGLKRTQEEARANGHSLEDLTWTLFTKAPRAAIDSVRHCVRDSDSSADRFDMLMDNCLTLTLGFALIPTGSLAFATYLVAQKIALFIEETEANRTVAVQQITNMSRTL